MLIYNRKTEKQLRGGIITFDRKEPRHIHARLNVMACAMMGVGKTDHVSFMFVGGEWFIVKSSKEEGYNLSPSGKGLRVNSKGLVMDVIEQADKKGLAVSCRIRRTTKEFQGNPLFKIVLH